MAIGDMEKKYLEDMAVIHDKAVKLSETYLGKSDNTSRPDSVVQMAARNVQQHNYSARELRSTSERLSSNRSSAEQAAARLRGDIEY